MPIKILMVGFLLGTFSTAQEVRQIDLTGVRESIDSEAVASGNYMICGTDEARNAPKAVRVSVQSLTPTEIHPKQQISVVLRVENHGRLPVVLPVTRDITVLQPEGGSIRYLAMLPLGAGVPSGAIRVGSLELYGSTLKPNTTISLRPGEWLTVRGDISVRRWYASKQQAKAYSDLQLYEWSTSNSDSLGECVKQVQGASITVRFSP